MKSNKQEQGYALITVLLIVTIFTILSLSFMGYAFNSMKQTQKTEKKSQSVALAEMGVSYYDVAIQSIFESTKAEIKEKVEKNEITTEAKAIEYMIHSLENGIKDITPDTVADNATYTIDKDSFNIDITPDGNVLKINGNVLGTKELNNTTVLNVEMVINNLSTIDIKPTGATTPPEITFGKVTRPDTWDTMDSACRNPNSFDNLGIDSGNQGNGKTGNSDTNKICPDVRIDSPLNGTKIYTENNNVNVLKVYSTVDLQFTKNLNNREGLQIYANSLDIGSNFSNPKAVTVETKYNLKIGSNVQNTDGTKFFVGGILNINGQLDLEKSSKVFIRGIQDPNKLTSNFNEINGKLNILSGSKMCVNGNLKVNSNVNITEHDGLIIKGKVYDFSNPPKPKEEYNPNIFYIDSNTDKEWLKTQCGNTFEEPTTSNTIDWGTITNALIKEVTYN